MRTRKEKPSGAARAESLGMYYNASQLRIDTWNRLKSTSARLADGAYRREARKDLKRRATQALDVLAPIESY